MQDRGFFINLGHAQELGLPPNQEHVDLHSFATSDTLIQRALEQIAFQLKNDLTGVKGTQQLQRHRRSRLEVIEDTDLRTRWENNMQEVSDHLASQMKRLRDNVDAAITFLNIAFAIPSSRIITRGALKDCMLPDYPQNPYEALPIRYTQFSGRIRRTFTQDQLLTPLGSEGKSQLTFLGETIHALSVATNILYPTE